MEENSGIELRRRSWNWIWFSDSLHWTTTPEEMPINYDKYRNIAQITGDLMNLNPMKRPRVGAEMQKNAKLPLWYNKMWTYYYTKGRKKDLEIKKSSTLFHFRLRRRETGDQSLNIIFFIWSGGHRRLDSLLRLARGEGGGRRGVSANNGCWKKCSGCARAGIFIKFVPQIIYP